MTERTAQWMIHRFSDTRFAWPTGYGWHGSLIYGLPEFDWFLTWEWIMRDSRWEPADGIHRKRSLLFRIAIPARTTRHVRAVAHSLDARLADYPRERVAPRLCFRQKERPMALRWHQQKRETVRLVRPGLASG